MLQITIPANERWDEASQEFIYNSKDTVLTLEHSLLSLSKWESIWHKPFLTDDPKSQEERISYIQCMTINQNADPNVYRFLTDNNIKQINDYISDSMTATWFSDDKDSKSSKVKKEIITSELIYYRMVVAQIPLECQKWHLNRLLTLLRVWNIKQAEENGKQSGNSKDMAKSNASVMAARRAKMKKPHI